MPGVELVAVGGRSPGTAGALAAAVGVPDRPLETLIDGPDRVDGLIVAVPPRAVADILARIPSSVAVLVESPVGLHGSGHSLASTAVNLLHAPTVKRALRAIVDLGAVHHLVLRSRASRPRWGAHGTPAFGGGVLVDPAAGVLPVLLAAAGVPATAVAATVEREPSSQGTVLDIDARLTLELADGRTARAELSWTDGPAGTELEAASDRGVVVVRLWPRPELEIDGRVLTSPTDESPLVSLGFVEQIRRFAAVAAGRALPWPPLTVGDGVLAIAEAAALSARRHGEFVPAGAHAARDPIDVLSDDAD